MTDSFADLAVAIAMVGLFGCGTGHDESAASGTSITAAPEPGPQPSESSSGGTSEGRETTTGDQASETTSGSDDGADSFVASTDVAGRSECDIWTQDCPRGEKCMPWANDGGTSWNATRCSPVVASPDQPGDACSVEGSDVSGLDSCGPGAMCWSVDPETNEGTCFPFCQGSSDSPLCEDPNALCSITNEGVLALCLPTCSPLLQDCAESHGCYPLNGDFGCMPDYSYRAGGYGEACEFINVCDAGLFCALPGLVPGCVGATGCCSEYCELGDPKASCQGANDGQECIAWYAEGAAPPGLEAVGICGVPT